MTTDELDRRYAELEATRQALEDEKLALDEQQAQQQSALRQRLHELHLDYIGLTLKQRELLGDEGDE